MTLTDIILGIIIIVILGLAIIYVIKSKKSGVKCIGCPSGCNCSNHEKKCNCGNDDHDKH